MGGGFRMWGTHVHLWLIQVEFMVSDGRNHHNIVKQLSSTIKKNEKTKMRPQVSVPNSQSKGLDSGGQCFLYFLLHPHVDST